MRRYRAVLGGLLVAVLAGGGAFALFWAVRQVPEFYEAAEAAQPDPIERQEAAKVFVQRTLNLVDGIQHADQWSEAFTQTQINSWLAEELYPNFGQLVPKGVSEPRVQLTEGVIEVGFRYHQPHWNSVVSVRARPWVPNPNQLAFEILSIRAGLVPIPLEHILHELSDHFEMEGWRVEWRELNGNDVVVLHLDRATSEQTVLEAIQITGGTIRVAGRRGPITNSEGQAGADRLSASGKAGVQ